MNDEQLQTDFSEDAREIRARMVYKAVKKEERPDIAVSIILKALDEWYETGRAAA